MGPTAEIGAGIPGARVNSQVEPVAPHHAPLLAFAVPLWRRTMPLLGALLFALTLASLPNNALRCCENYLAHLADTALIMLSWLDGHNISILITNEPLWTDLNATHGVWLEPAQALQLLNFIPATVVAHQALRMDPKSALLLLAFLLTAPGAE